MTDAEVCAEQVLLLIETLKTIVDEDSATVMRGLALGGLYGAFKLESSRALPSTEETVEVVKKIMEGRLG